MARIDFTEQLEAMSEIPEIQDPPKYKRVKNDALTPGIELEVYVNQSDPNDIYFAPQSVCLLMGLSRNWVNGAFARPSTLDRLVRRGFKAQKHMIDVLVENSATHLSKPCIALDRADFDAIMSYAVSIGKKQAIALNNAFTVLGLVSVAGFTGDADYFRERFIKVYEQCQRELASEYA